LQRRRTRRRPPVIGGLFVRVRQFDQRTFRPRHSEKRDACREFATDKTHRHGDGWKACSRRQRLAVISGRSAQVADEPRWIVPRGIDNGGNVRLLHGAYYSVAAFLLSLPAWSVIHRTYERHFRIAHAHFDRWMKAARRDDLGEVLHGRRRIASAE